MKTSFKSTLALVWPFLRRRKRALVGVVALGMLSTVGPAVILGLFPILWDHVLFPGQDTAAGVAMSGWWTSNFEGLRDWYLGADAMADGELSRGERQTMLGVVVTIAMGLTLLSASSQFAFTMLSRWLSLRLVIDLRLKLAQHLLGLSMRYHRERRFGDLLSRISADVEKMLATVQLMLRDFIQKPSQILASFSMAVIVAPKLAMVMLVTAPALAIPVSILAKKVRKRSTRSLTTLGSSVQTLTQMFQGVRTVKAYRAEERELEGFRGVNETYLKHTMGMVRAIAASNAWTLLISHGGLSLMLIPVGWFAIQGTLTGGGELLTFFLLMSQVYTHVKGFTRVWTNVQEAVGASERLHEILDERADVVESEDPVPLTGLGAGIRLEGVSLQYDDESEPALAGVDLELRPGETIAVVGPSGAGKSTLADVVCRFIDPTEGRITVDGIDLRDCSRDDWCRLCAHVDQVPFLFHASIRENIRYGKPEATDAEIVAAAKAANIHEFIEALPDGYDTDVADAGARLSGGQRQRIVIARAVLREAPLLILDEATSALDTESEAAVQEALDRLMENRTVLVIAHRLSTIRNADRIAVLEAGRLVELGTHDELVTNGGVYARLHSLQQLGVVGGDVITPHAGDREPADATTRES